MSSVARGGLHFAGPKSFGIAKNMQEHVSMDRIDFHLDLTVGRFADGSLTREQMLGQ
jgi:poly-gamma-glutamate capsule biosynthesis protein CapA/YwtB (metallophosphatase superfamily)